MQRTFRTRKSRFSLAATAAAVLGMLVALTLTAIAPAESVKTIGGVRGKAPPSCPSKNGKPQKACETMARVTAYQMVANGKKAPMRVRQDGKIVAWSINVSKPSRDEQQTLTEGFELGEPTAKLAILKPQGKGKFKLTKQSPRVKVKPLLGTEPVITLKKPIRVSKGTIVAITTSSWLPNLAHDGQLTSRSDKWRASRNSEKCRGDQNLLDGRPQRKVGSVKRYGCTYSTARLLYEAYYVPTSGGGGN